MRNLFVVRRTPHTGRAVGLAFGLLGLAGTAVAVPPALATVSDAAPTRPVTPFHPGSPSLHDPLVPGYGNGGYDVSHYGIRLHYNSTSGLLSGTTRITAQLKQNLSRFNLDFALPVRSVTVNGRTAAFRSKLGQGFYYGKELVVTPARGLRKGSRMTVTVTYSAKPRQVKVHGVSGWFRTPTGASWVDEPIAATEWWYPGNDYPSDKASYDVTVTTPRADTAISNGKLLSRKVHGTQATSHWRSTAPMATYLAFLTIGRYAVVTSTTPQGLPMYTAYERGGGVLMQRARRDLSRTPEVIGFLQKRWGPYPFDVGGGSVIRIPYGGALETQTRPTYEVGIWRNSPRNIWVVVHETSHLWFGDSVTMARWRHIWLAEGFATYSEWVWSQAHGNGTAEQLFKATYAQYPKHDAFWKEPLVHPAYALELQAYFRGVMTLQALRNRVGSPTFFAIMRTWVRVHRHSNADSADFAALATSLSGQDLRSFFHAWLYAAHRPAPTPRNGFPPGSMTALAEGHVRPPPSYSAIHRTYELLRQHGPSRRSVSGG
jgi:aminopeptidase N